MTRRDEWPATRSDRIPQCCAIIGKLSCLSSGGTSCISAFSIPFFLPRLGTTPQASTGVWWSISGSALLSTVCSPSAAVRLFIPNGLLPRAGNHAWASSSYRPPVAPSGISFLKFLQNWWLRLRRRERYRGKDRLFRLSGHLQGNCNDRNIGGHLQSSLDLLRFHRDQFVHHSG